MNHNSWVLPFILGFGTATIFFNGYVRGWVFSGFVWVLQQFKLLLDKMDKKA